MTIIAYAGGQIACDSLACNGDAKSYVKKFRTLSDGRVVFVAGRYSTLSKVVRLLNKGAAIPESVTDHATIVVYQPKDGSCVVYDESADPEPCLGQHTWGSGASYGIAALYLDADVVQACEVAKRFSSSCGGKIHLFTPE